MESKRQTLNQILVFLVTTSIISAGIFIWMFNGAQDSLKAVLPMMFTPGISAIITALIFRENIRNWGWKINQYRYLTYAFFLPLLVSVIGYGIFWMTEYADFTPEKVIQYRWAKMVGFELPAPFVVGMLSKMIIATIFTSVIVFGEELGWSGFLTTKLRKVYSVPVTSIVVGGYWALWHFPAIIGGFYGYGTTLWIALPGFTLVLIGASFLRTVLVEKSKSLWPGVLLHASHNVILMGLFLEMTVQRSDLDIHLVVSETGLFLGLIYLLIALVFWKWKS